MRTTWRLFGPLRRDLALGIAFRLVQALFTGLPAAMIVWVVDMVQAGTLSAARAWTVVAVLGVSLAGHYLSSYLSNRYAWVSTFEAIGKARVRVLAHIQRLPMGAVLERGGGDISAVLTGDFENVANFAHHAMPLLIGGGALPVVVLAALAVIDPLLALAAGVSIMAAVPVFIWMNRVFAAQALVRADRLAAANSRIVEYVRGITVARAYNQAGARQHWFTKAVADVRRVNDLMAVRLVPRAIAAMGITQLGVPLVIAVGAYRYLGGAIDAGTVVVFLVLVLRVYSPLIDVAFQVESLRLADASLRRIGRVMDMAGQSSPPDPAEPAGHRVTFEDVSFGYDPDTQVIHDVSFSAGEGTMTAIVGPSGAGKSTLLHLIARFWDPGEGTVRIGGADVRQMTPGQLFEAVTVVFQDVYLFQGTIRDNIAFGRAEARDEDVINAARAAQAHDFIAALPGGYATRIGEGGGTLSAGERQRIAVARAILKDSPIVLLDEPTASMDSLNERALQHALRALVAGKTVLVVAHRLSTIRSAGQILVVDHGRIVQRGSHDELIGADGLYRRFWRERQRAAAWQVRPAPASPARRA